MKRLYKLIGACLNAAIVAACGGTNNGSNSLTPLSVAPQIGLNPSRSGLRTERTRPTVMYRVLYSFDGAEDGAFPWAGLINVQGTLYGTTSGGGGAKDDGTVFAITRSGAETVLYRFKGHSDGASPLAGLINVKGTLYGTTSGGTTSAGGPNCDANGYLCGTVFSITTSGKLKVLHNFSYGSGDGIGPVAGLINVNGTLYGTTEYGGAKCSASALCGTVFSITTSGAETVLHTFGASGDGAEPFAGLIDVNGTLYGTTYYGGGIGCRKDQGCGTIFAITTSGKETVLHSFAGGKRDGQYPYAGLINVKGTLYGTTSEGGISGNGTVFSITTSGKEGVLHGFKGYRDDGAQPQAGLINVNGTLYGTTSEGGEKYDGTVFAITASGKETVLHSFAFGKGAAPSASLLNVNGTLYGTTYLGGKGAGTVFSLSP